MSDARQGERGGRHEVTRRSFLEGGLVGAGVGAALAGAGVATASRVGARPAAPGGGTGAVSFHGPHQAGIITPAPRRTVMCSFDVVASGRTELADLLRTMTDRARRLTAGGPQPPVGITAPPPDSGILGPSAPAGGLTATVGVGASLFDGRHGLGERRPARLAPMPTFPNDRLDPAQCHGDLSLQLCAGDEDTVLHALRDLTRHTRGGMQLRWRMDGFLSPPRPSGTPRNLMGFKDGISNPDAGDPGAMGRLVWVGQQRGGPRGYDEPAWTHGGTYLVVRLIRMLTEFWDRISISEQEHIFGRRRDSGAPLDGMGEDDQPDFAPDPTGAVIPLTSHIRLANPRTPQSAPSRILRRAYNYDRGIDQVGNLDMGLVFVCYQQDPVRQFEAVQKRLNDEPLSDYISPFGGGYFFVLPGVRDASDYLGRAMVS